jgi:hypothetical protein
MNVVRTSPSVDNDFEFEKSAEAGVVEGVGTGSRFRFRSKAGLKPEYSLEKTRYEASRWMLVRTGARIQVSNLARMGPPNFQWWIEGPAAAIATSFGDTSREPNQLRVTAESVTEAWVSRYRDGAVDGWVEPRVLTVSVDLN